MDTRATVAQRVKMSTTMAYGTAIAATMIFVLIAQNDYLVFLSKSHMIDNKYY